MINNYSLDNVINFDNTCPLDSDGEGYLPLERLGQ